MIEIVKPARMIQNHELVLRASENQEYVAKMAPGTTYEEMKNPLYWAPVAKRLRPGDLIIVKPSDASFRAELIVIRVDEKAAVVDEWAYKQFHVVAPPSVNLTVPPGLLVEHRGRGIWCVKRVADGEVVYRDGKSKEDAELWAIRYGTNLGMIQPAA